MIPLLLLILATLLAGPVGFVVAAVLIVATAIVTGTLHLLIDLVLLPFRANPRLPWLAEPTRQKRGKRLVREQRVQSVRHDVEGVPRKRHLQQADLRAV